MEFVWSNYSDLTRPHTKWWSNKILISKIPLFQGANQGWLIFFVEQKKYRTSFRGFFFCLDVRFFTVTKNLDIPRWVEVGSFGESSDSFRVRS